MTDISAQGSYPGQFSLPPPTAAPPKPTSRWNVRALVRFIWAAAMFVFLVVVWFIASPGERPSAQQPWVDELDWAAASYELNEVATQGAPQQQVANGWYTNDLGAIHAEQLTAQHAQSAYQSDVAYQLVALLGVVALAVTGDLLLRAWPTKPAASQSALTQIGPEYVPHAPVSSDTALGSQITDDHR